MTDDQFANIDEALAQIRIEMGRTNFFLQQLVEQQGAKKKKPAERPAQQQPDVPGLVRVWNSMVEKTALPQVSVVMVNSRRERALRQRMNEQPDMTRWVEIIERIIASRFCCGENDRKWKADFDWLIQPGAAAKVLEGKYDDRRPVRTVVSNL